VTVLADGSDNEMENHEVGKSWRCIMGIILKRIGVVVGLFILLVIISEPGFGMDTKTAYTRDGVNFVSKERVEENIKFEYAKPGDYKEVQVPLNKTVIGASIIPEITSNPEIQETLTQEKQPFNPDQISPLSEPENKNKYPYASIGIGLLFIVGVVFFVMTSVNGRGKQRKR
jgi:hypothetical protein